MTDETTKPPARQTMVARAAAGAGDIIGLDEKIPFERKVKIVVQSALGFLIFVIGVGILYVWGRGFLEDKAPSIWFLVSGIGVLGVGAFLVVGEVLGLAIKSVFIEPHKAYRRAMGKETSRGAS